MSSSEDQGHPTSRLDLREQQRKRQAQINEAMDWRSSNNNRMEDFDSNFKMFRDISKKTKVDNNVKSASSLPAELEPITYAEARKVGIDDEEMQRRNIVKAIQRQQYYDSRRSQ